MSIQAKTGDVGAPTTAKTFLRWNEAREGKREFAGFSLSADAPMSCAA